MRKASPFAPAGHALRGRHDLPRVRASKRFRVTLDTNRYSVPSEYASTRLTQPPL
ncbi:MAG: Mu transposase domain-containing protein [Methylococcales bacterium]